MYMSFSFIDFNSIFASHNATKINFFTSLEMSSSRDLVPYRPAEDEQDVTPEFDTDEEKARTAAKIRAKTIQATRKKNPKNTNTVWTVDYMVLASDLDYLG